MDPTCKLLSKCLKADESLEKCQALECNNVNHPSCSKKLMTTFGEDEWEGPLFCDKCCFKNYKRSLSSIAGRTKVGIPWSNDGPVAEVYFMSALIDWLTTGDN